MTLPNLPLEGERDEHEIEFRSVGVYGCYTAIIYVDGMKVDEVRGHSFREAYDKVRIIYPNAHWDGLDSDEEGDDEGRTPRMTAAPACPSGRKMRSAIWRCASPRVSRLSATAVCRPRTAASV